jgi:uncharacterized repeat protein (TIGR03803 family)
VSEKVSPLGGAILSFVLSFFILALAHPAWSQNYKVIYAFTGQSNLDAGSTIARDKFGNFYGASTESSQFCNGRSCGAIYKISPTGEETTLHEFNGSPDGSSPDGVLVIDKDGSIYGTTLYGGTSSFQYCGGSGCGTLFKLTNSGTYTVLHSFDSPPGDGIQPYAGVIMGPNGTLYGTTYYGGTGTIGAEGDGTIYQFANGKETVLYNFMDGADGGMPGANLLLHNRALYGTTVFGGKGPCITTFGKGCGTIFKLDKNGESTLLTFWGDVNGGFPAASLIADAAGNLYGTTVLGGDLNCEIGGPPAGCGVAFKLTPSGEELVLHVFSGSTDGAWPSAALVRDGAGNVYGTAYFGGDLQCDSGLGCGTIFKIDSSGKFSVIHTFHGQDGAFPMALIGVGNKLYGVTNGGPAGLNALTGVIYELTL